VELIILVWLACAGIGGAITNSKGRGILEGLVLGGLLGILGVIIAACLSQRGPSVPPGMFATQCYRCNAAQNVPRNQQKFECWQCKIANSNPGYIAPPAPSPKALKSAPSPKALKPRKIRCFDCGEVQDVPGEFKTGPCRGCGARMKIRPKTST
jgi:hypothetical protein